MVIYTESLKYNLRVVEEKVHYLFIGCMLEVINMSDTSAFLFDILVNSILILCDRSFHLKFIEKSGE